MEAFQNRLVVGSEIRPIAFLAGQHMAMEKCAKKYYFVIYGRWADKFAFLFCISTFRADILWFGDVKIDIYNWIC